MAHKTLEERRDYMRDWRAGLKRKDVKGKGYIDVPLSQEAVAADAEFRRRRRAREQARRQREFQRLARKESLAQEIRELCNRPFSWQKEAAR